MKYAEQYVLSLLEEGRISIGRAAELLEVTVYDVQRLAEAPGIELGATDEQSRRSRALAEKLAREPDL